MALFRFIDISKGPPFSAGSFLCPDRFEGKEAPSATRSDFYDEAGKSSSVYSVIGSNDSDLGLASKDIKPWGDFYLDIKLQKSADQTMPDATKATYKQTTCPQTIWTEMESWIWQSNVLRDIE